LQKKAEFNSPRGWQMRHKPMPCRFYEADKKAHWPLLGGKNEA
jgi:hypothetical protein